MPSSIWDREIQKALEEARLRADGDNGFRIDTLKYIEPEMAKEFGNAICEYALSLGKKHFFTFGEVQPGEILILGRV